MRRYDEAYIREKKLRKLRRVLKRWILLFLILLLVVVGLLLISRVLGNKGNGSRGNSGLDDERGGLLDFLGFGGENSVIPADEIELPDWITKAYIPVNEFSRPGDKLDAVNGVVVHYIGNPGTNGWQNHDYYENLAVSGEASVSSNFIIGLDGTVILCVPLDEVAYASNNRNSDTISIECCHPDAEGVFTDATYQSLVRLCAWLKELYGLDTEDIIRHYDVTGKICPKYYVENEEAWERLLRDIGNYSGK
ncbi:MAG: N-acetylmuramoyl-L-alanine amidase [Lachnospiraceae bacterium]|nr:N-acetylmuramoyl-L-alanine amidase [Lachnospiraceae bacterium]